MDTEESLSRLMQHPVWMHVPCTLPAVISTKPRDKTSTGDTRALADRSGRHRPREAMLAVLFLVPGVAGLGMFVIFPLFQERRAFVKAGLDPNSPPKTVNEITEAARNGKGKDDVHKRAAREFVKFLADKDSQTTWHTSTGYFPITKAAPETDADKQRVAQRPQFATAIEQLQATALSKATQGCLLGVMPQVRKGAERGMQAAVLSGTDPKAALQNEETAPHGPINDYNSSVCGGARGAP
jgi:hypothetical protein